MAATVVYLPWKESSIDGHTKPVWYNELTPSDPDSLAPHFYTHLDAWVTAVGGTKLVDISATTSSGYRGCAYELPDLWSPDGKIVFMHYGSGSTGPGNFDTYTNWRFDASFGDVYTANANNGGLGQPGSGYTYRSEAMYWDYPTYEVTSSICYSTDYPGKEWFMFQYNGLNSGSGGYEYRMMIMRNSLAEDIGPAKVADWMSRTPYAHSEWVFFMARATTVQSSYFRQLSGNQTMPNWPATSQSSLNPSPMNMTGAYSLNLRMPLYSYTTGMWYTAGDDNFGMGLDSLFGDYNTFKPDPAGTEKWMLPLREDIWVKVED
jgi:hypothetical protein